MGEKAIPSRCDVLSRRLTAEARVDAGTGAAVKAAPGLGCGHGCTAVGSFGQMSGPEPARSGGDQESPERLPTRDHVDLGLHCWWRAQRDVLEVAGPSALLIHTIARNAASGVP